MSIKDMKYTTVEDVLALREAALRTEQQRDALAEALRATLEYADDHICWPPEIRNKARAALKQLEEE